MLEAYDGVRLPDDLPGAERVRDRRSERALQRHLEGSALHVCRALEGASLGTDRDVCHGRGPHASVAPILSVSAEQLWQLPAAGKRDESVHLAMFPSAKELSALVDADLLSRWDRSERSSRPGARANRAAAKRQTDWQLPSSPRRPHDVERRRGVSGEIRAGSADAVHRVRGGASSKHRQHDGHRHRARRRREMRTLLASGQVGIDRSGMGRHLRTLRGCVGTTEPNA